MRPELHLYDTQAQAALKAGEVDPRVLWNDFRKGSELAFTAIYQRYVYDLYHFGELLTGHKEMIEDSIHDFFVELWKQRKSYKEITNLKAYLMRGFKYRLLKNLKKARRLSVEHNVSEDYDFEFVLSSEHEWIQNQLTEEQRVTLLKSINTLTPREKEAITLRFYDGLSYEEIAAIMDLSIKSTYKLLYRGIDALRKKIAPHSSIIIFALAISLVLSNVMPHRGHTMPVLKHIVSHKKL